MWGEVQTNVATVSSERGRKIQSGIVNRSITFSGLEITMADKIILGELHNILPIRDGAKTVERLLSTDYLRTGNEIQFIDQKDPFLPCHRLSVA